MPETIHLFVRREADGFCYVTSPQAPGLMYGERTIDAVRNGIQDALAFHFDAPGPYRVVEHHERHHEIGDGELVTRVAIDDHLADRQVVQDGINAALRVPEQVDALLSAPANRVGEVVYVCAVAADTLGWLGAQLDPRGSDTVMIAAAVGETLLFTVALARDEECAEAGDLLIAQPDMTVAEVIRRTAIVGPAPVAHPMIRVPA
jgi:hypothetical protein